MSNDEDFLSEESYEFEFEEDDEDEIEEQASDSNALVGTSKCYSF